MNSNSNGRRVRSPGSDGTDVRDRVREGRVYPTGSMYQGPIINFSKTERAAKQLFPEEFGEEQLYDRQRIADIRAGDV